MKKSKSFFVFCDVYQTNLFVVLGGTRENLIKLLRRRFDVARDIEATDLATGGGYIEIDAWPYHVLWVSGEQKKVDSIPVIAHEIFHFVVSLCDHKRIPIEARDNNEPAAYLMEFYMREILAKL